MVMLSNVWASVRARVFHSPLTAAERANLRAAVAIPAVYTASLGGHVRPTGPLIGHRDWMRRV